MTEGQKRFVELDRKKDEVKKFFDEYNAAVAAVVVEFEVNEAKGGVRNSDGIGYYFQDDEGIVYKTVEPMGKFVYYEKYAIERTRRKGETKGTLSMKEAQEAGFTLPEK